MQVKTKVYFGANQFSKKPCVVFYFLEITKSEKEEIIHNIENTIKYLSSHFGYQYTLDNKKSLDNILLFISHASLFILNYVRGDLDEYGYIKNTKYPSIFIEFHNQELTVKAFEIILNLLFKNKELNQKKVFNTFWNECQNSHPDWQAHALITAAKSKNIYYAPLKNNLWLYGMGSKSKIFFETSPLKDIKKNFQTDKLSGKKFFNKINVPTADYKIIETYKDALKAINSIGFPCAIKPINGGGGKGVTANIKTLDEFKFAYKEACKYLDKSKKIMVEDFVEGKDYRLMTVNGNLLACIHRKAPFIITDGKNTIKTLIYKQINKFRTRSIYLSNYRRPMPIDNSVIETLALQGFNLDSIPKENTKITLRRNDNLSTGGSAEIINNVHQDIINAAEKIIQKSGMYSLGIDYITTDISKSFIETGGKFIEVNKTQGIDALLAADYDITLAGEHFLGKDIENIPINLYILKEKNLQSFYDTYVGDYAIFLPNIIVKYNKKTKVINTHFTQILSRVLSDKSLVNNLDIIATNTFIENFGLPTEHINKIYIEKTCSSKAITKTIANTKCDIKNIC